MKKTKITQEQAEALEQVKESRGKDKVMNGVLGKWYRELEPLNDLTPSQMARALYIGYEVESEFKVGDWVVYKSNIHETPIVRKVSKINQLISGASLDAESIVAPLNNLRHATLEEIAEEKERRLFAESGREPWELAGGDILKANDGGYLVTVKAILPGGHPLFEGGKVYVDIEDVKRDYKVACFSHDRKDVDNE